MSQADAGSYTQSTTGCGNLRANERSSPAVTRELTTVENRYFVRQGTTFTALRTRTPSPTSSVDNRRAASERLFGPRRSRHSSAPRKDPVSTKSTAWPLRAARLITCCLFVGRSSAHSWVERQTIENECSPA